MIFVITCLSLLYLHPSARNLPEGLFETLIHGCLSISTYEASSTFEWETIFYGHFGRF